MMPGPTGSRALPHPWWTPARLVLALATAMFGLTVLVKTPCAEGAWWTEVRAYANLCASDLPAEYATGGLAEGVFGLSTSDGRFAAGTESVPQAVLSYTLGTGARALAGWPDTADRQAVSVEDVGALSSVRREAVVYVGLAALAQLAAFLATVGAVLALAGARRTYLLAGAPLVVLGGLVGWDLVPTALAVGALVSWERRRPVWAGALVGLGATWAFWPAVLAVAFVAAGLRRRGPAAVWRMASVALGGYVALALLAWVLSGGASNALVLSWLRGGAGDGSLAWIGGELGLDLAARTLTLVAVPLAVLGCLAVLAWALRTRRDPPVAGVVVALLVVLSVTAKGFAPGDALWMLPFAVLAYPDVATRTRDLLLWQGAECLFILATWWHEGDFTLGSSGYDPLFAFAILLRLAAEVALVLRLLTLPRSYATCGVPVRGFGRSNGRARIDVRGAGSGD